MDVTRNEQTISFIIDNGDLMQITPYVSKAGDAHRPMRTYLIDGMAVDAQDRALARQAAREWNAQIDNYSHADDEYATLKPTDETTTDSAPVAVEPADALAAVAADHEPGHDREGFAECSCGWSGFASEDDSVMTHIVAAARSHAAPVRVESDGGPIVARARQMAKKSGHRSWDGLPEMARDEYIARAEAESMTDPAQIVRYVVKFNASGSSDVVSMDYVRYADAAAYFWQLVATHESDGSSVPVSTNPLALRREGIESTRGITHRWMVSLDIVTGS